MKVPVRPTPALRVPAADFGSTAREEWIWKQGLNGDQDKKMYDTNLCTFKKLSFYLEGAHFLNHIHQLPELVASEYLKCTRV